MLSVGILLADNPESRRPEPASTLKAIKPPARRSKEAIERSGWRKPHEKGEALAGRGLNPLTDPLEKMFCGPAMNSPRTGN